MQWSRLCSLSKLMALLFELVSLVLKPLLLTCQIGARSISIIVLTWIEVLRFALCLHLDILWRLAICAIAVLTLPIRAFTALYRERLLETQLYRLKNELENILWDRKELEEKLRVAIKECNMMETMLIELEEEHDEAIVKIETLEGEVRDLKDEIQRLKEVHGKALLSYKRRDGMFDGRDHMTAADNLGKPSPKPDYNNNNKNIIQFSNGKIILAGHRDVALCRSLFSAMLSLLVGLVVWEAKNPCMPLVIGLFTVVAMSLASVIRLFTKIEHKPASDAVVLLSFNWFMLGTLAYPVVPSIARFSAPLTLSFMRRMFMWLGL